MKRWITALFCALTAPFILAANEPILVPEVSQREVNIQYGFTGADFLLFGAISYPDGEIPASGTDIVVILKGPPQSIILREKQQIAGVWVNADSTEFRSAPAFYAIASSRPITEMVDERTAAIYEFGLSYLQLSPAGSIRPEEQRRFTEGLVDLRQRGGLYAQNSNSVTISEQVLYQARLSIPASVPVGIYTAETFLVQDGRVLAAAVREINVRKYGFELFVATMAEYQPFFYGVAAVIISLLFGWVAGLIFQRLN